MEAETGSRLGPSEKAALCKNSFDQLVNFAKSEGIDEDNAEDLAQNAMIRGWDAYKNKKGNPKTLPSLIWHILQKQLIPQHFRDQSHVVKGSLVKKKERIDLLSSEDKKSISHVPYLQVLDRATLYKMMRDSLPTEKLKNFLNALLEARDGTDKKQFIKRAASIAKISEKDARNRYRQIKTKLKSNPELLSHIFDR